MNNLGIYPVLSSNIAISLTNEIILIEVVMNNSSKLFISRDFGVNWIQIEQLPDNPINVTSYWKVAMSDNGNTILIGMGVFVYISNDIGQTWTRITYTLSRHPEYHSIGL